MKGIIILLLSLGLTLSLHKADSQEGIINPSKRELKVDEQLLYKIELLGIPIGWIDLRVEEEILFNGNPCYHITAHAYTNRFFKKIYDVEYRVDTYIDRNSLLPYRFQKKKRLKNNITFNEIDFDWIKQKANISNKMNGEQSRTSIDLDGKVSDLLSSIYHFRLLPLDYDSNYNLNVFYGDKPWQINIKIVSFKDIEIYRRGVFHIFEAEITTELSRVILSTPKLNVYFINDERRTPLIFFIRLPFGQLVGRLFNPL